MSRYKHQYVRTTLTLDDDVAAKIQAYCRRTGRSMKAAVNELLRLGLNAPRAAEPQAPYKVRARRLTARPGVNLDNIAELLEQVDGPDHK
jgi:Arc/MetJ family transcription regulator